MAGLMNWQGEEELGMVKFTKPTRLERKGFNLETDKPPLVKGDDEVVESMSRSHSRHSRSKSQADRIQEVLNWADESLIKE